MRGKTHFFCGWCFISGVRFASDLIGMYDRMIWLCWKTCHLSIFLQMAKSASARVSAPSDLRMAKQRSRSWDFWLEISSLVMGQYYQSLFSSYPSLTSKSPAASLNNFLCSSVKCCFHPPVFPERKVWLFFGWMASTNTASAFSRCVGIL